MSINQKPTEKIILFLCFILIVICGIYIAYFLKDNKIFNIGSIIIAIIFYWMGYGRVHHIVFKNATFKNPVESIKGFLFFLLFFMVFIIVFAKYFIPSFRY